MQDFEALAELVNSHLRRGVSTRDIANRSQGGISHGTVANIANRTSGELKETTLAGLARGLGMSYEEVQAIAKGKRLEHKEPFEALRIYFHRWDEASERDRRDVLIALRLIGEGFQKRLNERLPGEAGGVGAKPPGALPERGKRFVKVEKAGKEKIRDKRAG